MSTTRKHTRYELCDRHRPWFQGQTRRRQIECLAEGGPGGWTPGCEGGKCRLWPGADMFDSSVCGEELELDWTTKSDPFEGDAGAQLIRGTLQDRGYEDAGEKMASAADVDWWADFVGPMIDQAERFLYPDAA